MCNPNITPNGSEATGLKTGNWLPDTSQYRCVGVDLAHFERLAQQIRVTVTKLRDSWLKHALIRQGAPVWMMEGVSVLDRESLDLAHKWIRVRGYSFGCRRSNTIELYQWGHEVDSAVLFTVPDPSSYGLPTA